MQKGAITIIYFSKNIIFPKYDQIISKTTIFTQENEKKKFNEGLTEN